MTLDVDRPVHPLHSWIESHSVKEALKLCRSRGFKTKEVYLKQIAAGYYRPSYELAKAIADIVGGGTTVADIMDYPYVRKPEAA